MNKFAIPAIVFALLAVGLYFGLNTDSQHHSSAYQGKSAPSFTLPNLLHDKQQISSLDLKNKVVVLNFWASWCGACVTEHPVLIQLGKDKRILMLGIAYKDSKLDAKVFLKKHGNPFHIIGDDKLGNTGLDFGVSKVPETFIIDKQGIVRFKHLGPINWQKLRTVILPLIEKLDKMPAKQQIKAGRK